VTRQVRVEIIGDSSSVQRAFNSAAGGVESFGSKVLSVAGGIIGAQVIDRIVGTFTEAVSGAIEGASELQQIGRSVSTTFGKSAGDVQAWSSTVAEAFGLSDDAALKAADSYGVMLHGLGFTDAASAKASEQLTGLAADLAAFSGQDVTTVMGALQKGLAGSAKPLKQFGVFLDTASVKQEAVRLGLYKGKGPLSNYAAAQARLSLIMRETTRIQGTFASRSGDLATVQKQNAAEIKNVADEFGTMLLPAVTAIASFVGRELLPAIEQLVKWLGPRLAPVVAAIAPLLQAVADFIGKQLVPAVSDAAPLFADLADAVGSALRPALAILWPIIQKVGTFIAEQLWPAVVDVARALLTALAPIIRQLGPLFEAWAPYISGVVDFLLKLAGVALRVLVPSLKFLIGILAKVIGIVLAVMTGIGRLVSTFWRATTPIRTAILSILNTVATIVVRIQGAIARFLGGILDRVRSFITPLFNLGAALVGALGRGLSSMFGTLTGAARDLIGRAVAVLGSPLGRLFSIGQDIVGALIRGIESMAGAILRAIVGILPGPVRGVIQDALGLHGAGYAAPLPPTTPTIRALGGAAARTPAAPAGPSITVNGAIDPEATARVLRRTLQAHDIRVGRTSALATGAAL